MTDILQKIKDWDFSAEESGITLNLDYIELAEISDIVERKIWFIGEIDEGVIESIVYNIIRYNTEDKGKPVEKRKPIIIYLNSIGGETISGMGLVSAIQTSITPVYTINMGQCSSIALVVFLSGHKRYTMPNSVFLMHEGFGGSYDSISKAKETTLFFANQYEDVIKQLTIEKTALTKKDYEKKYKEEWFFLPEEAKKYRFVDEIIGKDCSLEEII